MGVGCAVEDGGVTVRVAGVGDSPDMLLRAAGETDTPGQNTER